MIESNTSSSAAVVRRHQLNISPWPPNIPPRKTFYVQKSMVGAVKDLFRRTIDCCLLNAVFVWERKSWSASGGNFRLMMRWRSLRSPGQPFSLRLPNHPLQR